MLAGLPSLGVNGRFEIFTRPNTSKTVHVQGCKCSLKLEGTSGNCLLQMDFQIVFLSHKS